MKELYKKDKLGRINYWAIEVFNGSYRMYEGIVGGKITITNWTECFEKNIGKKNYINKIKQAEKEADALYKKKLKGGYFRTIQDASDTIDDDVMKAHIYQEHIDFVKSSSDLIFLQPKLDGIRCRITKEGIFTKNNEIIYSASHIHNVTKTLIDKLEDKYKIKIDFLDGELYNHKYKDNFNIIQSLVTKKKLTDLDYKKTESLLEFHIFDIAIKDLLFSQRLKLINDDLVKNTKYIHIVETLQVKDLNDIENYYECKMKESYEGIMIRLNSCYYNGRTKNLLKYKKFLENDYVLIDILEGKGNSKGKASIAILKLDNKSFKAGIVGDGKFLNELLINKNDYIDSTVTVKYQNLTPDGIPRFAKVIKFRKFNNYDC